MNNWANGFDPAVHIDKLEATIAQQQARIGELEGLARESQEWAKAEATAANDAVLRVATLEQALAAERERAEMYKLDAENWRKDVSRWKQNFSEVNKELQAEREHVKKAEANYEAEVERATFWENKLQAEREKSASLTTQAPEVRA